MRNDLQNSELLIILGNLGAKVLDAGMEKHRIPGRGRRRQPRIDAHQKVIPVKSVAGKDRDDIGHQLTENGRMMPLNSVHWLL